MDVQIAIEKLKDQQTNNDTESAHAHADDILCEFLVKLGYQNIVDEYNKVSRWYA